MMNYKHSDEAIKLFDKKLVRLFSQYGNQINGFDELNVIGQSKVLYRKIRKQMILLLLDVVRASYKTGKGSKESSIDENWIIEYMLEDYDPVLNCIPDNELDRGREQASERAIGTKTADYLDKSKKTLHKMFKELADEGELAGYKQALKDEGIEYVMWQTERDTKVCAVCRALEGKVFSIDKVPPLQHINCRCKIKPYIGDLQ